MRLKSFYGPNMTEAMRLVREALGQDAIIVATHNDEMSGVRVTAAIDDPQSVPEKTILPPPAWPEKESESLDAIAAALVQHQVPSVVAEKLLASATTFAGEDALLAMGAALDMHFKFAPIAPEEDNQPVILIGPPGAGKTLCTAKLATQATIAKTPVSVIGTDTERAGGMDQLGAFVRLLKINLIEIEDAHALKDALTLQRGKGPALIDTAGCNPFDRQERQKLEAMVVASGAMPVLVLPADLDVGEAADLIKAFESLSPQRLLFTRLDLTRRMGRLLGLAHDAKCPLSSFSASAKVSEPLQPFNPVSLARLILPKTGQDHTAQRATGTQ